MENDTNMCVNFNQICRCCLSQGGVMSAIFDDGDGSTIPLPSKIMACVSSVQMFAGDGLPELICSKCLNQVEKSFEFKELCENSDATLRSYLSRELGITSKFDQETSQDSGDPLTRALAYHGAQYVVRHGEEGSLVIVVDPSAALADSGEDTVVVKKKPKPQRRTVERAAERPFVCAVCGKGFTRATNLRKHARIHSGVRPYACGQCPKSFSAKGDLTRHLLVHSGHKPFSCRVCGGAFSRRDKLTRHEKTHLAENSVEPSPASQPVSKGKAEGKAKTKGMGGATAPVEKQFLCGTCGKVFARRRELSRHEKVHSGDRPFVCDVCGKGFSRRDKLTRHEQIHSAPRLHACAECPATFPRRDELARHTLCHSGERPWCCPLCYRAFYSRAELNRHAKTHSAVKPFSCTQCPMSFCRRDKLARHQRTHSGNRSFRCQLCSASFTRRDSLTKHLVTHPRPPEDTAPHPLLFPISKGD